MKIFLPIMIFADLLIGCTSQSKRPATDHPFVLQSLLDSNFHKKSFDSLLSIICKDTSGLGFSASVLANSSFRVIYEHSAAYLPDAAELLLKGQFNSMQASVCIFSMQNLSAVDYVSFCELYLKLYNAGMVKEGMLEQAILPNFNEKRIISENYENPNVVALLQHINQNQKVSMAFKNEISKVLDGSYIGVYSKKCVRPH